MRQAIWVLLGAGLAALGASHAGALHPLGDALAVIRLHIAAACLALALILAIRQRRAGALAAAAALAALAPILWISFGPQSGTAGPVAIYQKNMLFRQHDLSPLIADIRAADPDVLMLQEVTPANEMLLDALGDRLPAQLVCRFARVGAVGIATRWPQVAGGSLCLEGLGLAGLRVTGPQGPVWLLSVHLHWPWPHGQAAQLARLLPVLEALQGPVLIGGDFNMVPWSATLRRVARATGTRRIGRAFNSLPVFSPLAPLPIDHVLVPAGATGTLERRARLGSDHYGLLARITLPAQQQP